jgi:hypothetical protein
MAAAALACAAAALAQTPAASFAPLAHSAQLSADGALAGDTLIVRLRHAAGAAPLTGALLSVSVDGRALPVTALADGTFVVALKDLPARSPRKLDLVVAHDGVRELLSATLPGAVRAAPAAEGAAQSASARHKQLAWWILNIAIVLIGVIAISRRMS